MTGGLVIGTQDIAHKEEMLLRALVRLLDGGINVRARFSEQLSECNVVFVPGHGAHRLPAPCVAVRVKDADQVCDAHDGAGGMERDLVVSAPLRMTNVIAVLQAATQRVHGVAQGDPVQGLQALFALLRDNTRLMERRRVVVPMSSGQQIVFDFLKQRVHTATPMDVLLSGAYTLGTPHRVSPVEEELISLVPCYSLRHLLWSLSLRLAQVGAPAPDRTDRYQLLRWPDAMALAAPGHPRLAALWTHSALSLEQICATSGVPDLTARWFLEACLALGLVADPDSSPATQPVSAAPEATASSFFAAAPPPGWFNHLRERLKLW